MSDKQKDNGGVTMRILPEETGAVVIDMQEKLMMAMNETKGLRREGCNASERPQVLSIPTVIVQQYTKGTGPTHCRHFIGSRHNGIL